MARKPNYRFERMERDRTKAAKLAAKAAAKKRDDGQDAAAPAPERDAGPVDGEA